LKNILESLTAYPNFHKDRCTYEGEPGRQFLAAEHAESVAMMIVEHRSRCENDADVLLSGFVWQTLPALLFRTPSEALKGNDGLGGNV
jgi:hypothetical protein